MRDKRTPKDVCGEAMVDQNLGGTWISLFVVFAPNFKVTSFALRRYKNTQDHFSLWVLCRFRLREVPHFSSGIVERAKRDHA